MTAALVLDRPALVLNKRWDPIQVTTVKEAICLVAKGSAKVVEPETFETYDLMSWADASRLKARHENEIVHGTRFNLAAPEVVVLTNYEGLGERSVVFSRKNLFKRDRYTCQYCGGQPGPEELTIDHVMPKARGGRSTWENCALACVECNAKKANRTPEEAGMKLRKQPKKPSWRVLTQIHPKMRRESWDKFISRAYWEIELES